MKSWSPAARATLCTSAKCFQTSSGGFCADLRIEKLPSGLEAYYGDHWARMEMLAKGVSRARLNVIYVLSALGRPVSCQLLSEYCEEDEVTIQAILDEWGQFLHGYAVGGMMRYAAYHSSFREFLHRKDIISAAGVSLREVHRKIASKQLHELFGTGLPK